MANSAKRQPTGDYSTGYCKPPAEHQWQKGQSGNPRGRKKLSSDIAECTERALGQIIQVQRGGRLRRVTVADAVAQQLVRSAATGDRLAIRDVRRLQQEYAARGRTDEDGDMVIEARLVFDDEPDIYKFTFEENQRLKAEIALLKDQINSTPRLAPPAPSDETES